MGKGAIVIIGAIVTLLGVAGLFLGGVPYDSQETVLDVGPLQAQVETERRWEIPPVAAAVLLVGGIGIMAYGATRPGSRS